MKNTFVHLAALLVLAFGFASHTLAVPIPYSIFNTGVDNSNAPLPFGSVDPHWVLSAAPVGGPNALVQNPRPGSWVANTSDSQWIGRTANGSQNVPPGLYVFDQAFDLTGFDETTATLTGDWASDNSSQIFLNGVNTGISHVGGGSAFLAFDTFTLNTGFVPGINTLSMRVLNFGGPGGLHVDALRGLAEPIPEPVSLVLVVTAVGLACAIRRRR